jgi:hypothetical protein
MPENELAIAGIAVLLIAVWAIFIWAGARLAVNKGRSRTFGAVLAAVLPIFGLIILAFLPSRRDPRDRPQITQPIPPEQRPE